MHSHCPSRAGHRACLPCSPLRPPAPLSSTPAALGMGRLIQEFQQFRTHWPIGTSQPVHSLEAMGREQRRRERLEHLIELVKNLHEGGKFSLTRGKSQEVSSASTMPLPYGGAQSPSPRASQATLSSPEAASWPKALSHYMVQLIIFAFCIKKKEKRLRCSSVVKSVFMIFAGDPGVSSQYCTHTQSQGWAAWCTIAILAPRRPRQEDQGPARVPW